MKKISNSPPVILLQHPREKKKEQTTADLICELFENVTLKSGLSWKNLKSVGAPDSATPKNWVVLYLGAKKNLKSGHVSKDKLYSFLNTKGEPYPLDPIPLSTIEGIILLDGTWKQSKTLWWRNAWLTRLSRMMLIPKKPSLYSKIKREPRRECLSTIESLALILDIIKPENKDSKALLNLFIERLNLKTDEPKNP